MPEQASGLPSGWSWADTPPDAPPSPMPRDSRGMPVVSSNTSDGPPSDLLAMLGPLAHPETLTDFARLLTLPVDSVRKALIASVAGAAARGPAATALTKTGQGLEAVGDSRAARLAEAGGVADAVYRGDLKGVAVAAAPTVLKFAGRGLQKAGAALAPAEEMPPPAAWTRPSQMTDAEIAAKMAEKGVVRGPRPPSTIQRPPGATYANPTGAAPVEPVAAPPAEPMPPPPSAAAPTIAKVKLSGAEFQAATKLVERGMSEEQALQNVLGQRELIKRMGLPTSEQVRRSVSDRNASGRWPE